MFLKKRMNSRGWRADTARTWSLSGLHVLAAPPNPGQSDHVVIRGKFKIKNTQKLTNTLAVNVNIKLKIQLNLILNVT